MIPKMDHDQNISKIQKIKKKVLLVFRNATFWPKVRKYGENGDEFHCLEAYFQTPQIPGFPPFVGPYLGTTKSFFN